MKYKEFLDKLTPPEWFVKQREVKLARQAARKVTRLQARVVLWEEAKAKALAEAAAREQAEREALEKQGKVKKKGDKSKSRPVEVPPMPLLSEEADTSSGEEPPMYFAQPSQLLDIFTALEESNLFLIQNAQETDQVCAGPAGWPTSRLPCALASWPGGISTRSDSRLIPARPLARPPPPRPLPLPPRPPAGPPSWRVQALEELKANFRETKRRMDKRTSALSSNIEELKAQIAAEEKKADELRRRAAAATGEDKQEDLLALLHDKVRRCARPLKLMYARAFALLFASSFARSLTHAHVLHPCSLARSLARPPAPD